MHRLRKMRFGVAARLDDCMGIRRVGLCMQRYGWYLEVPDTLTFSIETRRNRLLR
jgi:hypothetical protein